MSARTRYRADYDYPGSFFPESTGRDVADARLDSVIAAQPDENWYAATVYEYTERKFTADNWEVRWLTEGKPKKTSYVVGQKIHVDDIPDTDQNAILRSNIRSNSKDGYAVKTRRGNWQMASDYDFVVEL